MGIMIFSCCFICVFASLVNKVSLQVTVEAVFGGSVVLPFSSAQHDHKPRDIDVYWRHNGSKIVFDIIKGKASVDQQDPRYKNRVETFPEEYLRGNFSLKLINLQHTDAGKYTCLISHSSKHETVELIIKESTEKGNKTNDQEKPNQAETVRNVVIIVVSVLVLLVVLIVIIIFYLRKKRAQAPLFSSDRIEEQTTVT
ncbi:CD276 antigen homolog isoform X2 [Onychostoma macrolepis]|uniref:CD276 antigen homolog isoform X2 n=1 Tax=Onychostoma macrolepis TaxID=369639 RepID=UPI002729BAC0|nr:CD276 antigen homolog isoform X2 [Onychostoma macrolepis]